MRFRSNSMVKNRNMTIERSVQRIAEKIQSGNKFKPNTSDLNAMNEIIEFVNLKKIQGAKENELFAKLYIKVYAKMLEHFNASVFDDEPRKAMHQILRMPLNQIVMEFKDKLNKSELYEVLDKSFNSNDPMASDSDAKQLNDKIKSEPQLKERVCLEVWDYETVWHNLSTEINNTINTFK